MSQQTLKIKLGCNKNKNSENLKNFKLKIRLIEKNKQNASVNNRSASISSRIKFASLSNDDCQDLTSELTEMSLTNSSAPSFECRSGVCLDNDEINRIRKKKLFNAYFNFKYDAIANKKPKISFKRSKQEKSSISGSINSKKMSSVAAENFHHMTETAILTTGKSQESYFSNEQQYDEDLKINNSHKNSEQILRYDFDDDYGEANICSSSSSSSRSFYLFQEAHLKSAHLGNLLEENEDDFIGTTALDDNLVSGVSVRNNKYADDESGAGEGEGEDQIPAKLQQICETNKLFLKKLYRNFDLSLHYIDIKPTPQLRSPATSSSNLSVKAPTEMKLLNHINPKHANRKGYMASQFTLNNNNNNNPRKMCTTHWLTSRRPKDDETTLNSLLLLSTMVHHPNPTLESVSQNKASSKKFHNPNKNLEILKISGKSLDGNNSGVDSAPIKWESLSSKLFVTEDRNKQTPYVYNDVKLIKDASSPRNNGKLPEIEVKKLSNTQLENSDESAESSSSSAADNSKNHEESKTKTNSPPIHRSTSFLLDYKQIFEYMPKISKDDLALSNKTSPETFKSRKRSNSLMKMPKNLRPLSRRQSVSRLTKLAQQDNNQLHELKEEFTCESLLTESNPLVLKLENKPSRLEPIQPKEVRKEKMDKRNSVKVIEQNLTKTPEEKFKRKPNNSIKLEKISDSYYKKKNVTDLDGQLPKSEGTYTHILTSTSQLKELYSTTSFGKDETNDNNYSTNLENFSTQSFTLNRENSEFLYNQQQVNKLKRQILQKMQQTSSNLEENQLKSDSINLFKQPFDSNVYKFYERNKTSILLDSIRFNDGGGGGGESMIETSDPNKSELLN